jgi:hypothetical protein
MGKSPLSGVTKDWIAIIGMLGIFVLLFGYNHYLSASLFKHLVIAGGTVTDAVVAPKRGKLVFYDFLIKGRRYSGSRLLPPFKNIHDRYVLLSHHFPVVADSTNYASNKILFDSSGFEEYGLLYPHSLGWAGLQLSRSIPGSDA